MTGLDILVIPGDMDALEQHADSMVELGVEFGTTGRGVYLTWLGLEPVYRTPEAQQLMFAAYPVLTVAATVGNNVTFAGESLKAYAHEVRAIQVQLNTLRARAASLEKSISEDKDWKQDEGKVNEHNDILSEVSALKAAFDEAQRRCANDIGGRYNGQQYRANDGVGVTEPDEYGFTTEQYDAFIAAGGKLPWGKAVQHDRGFLGDAQAAVFGVKDAAVMAGEDLGTLIGRDPTSGEFSWSTTGQSWKGMGTFVVAIGTAGPVGTYIDVNYGMPGFKRGELTQTLVAAGKGLVAYDEWEHDKARAGGMAVFNVVSAVVGTKGAGAGLRVGGTALRATRATGVAAKAGTVMIKVGTGIEHLSTGAGIANRVTAKFNLYIQKIPRPQLHLGQEVSSRKITIQDGPPKAPTHSGKVPEPQVAEGPGPKKPAADGPIHKTTTTDSSTHKDPVTERSTHKEPVSDRSKAESTRQEATSREIPSRDESSTTRRQKASRPGIPQQRTPLDDHISKQSAEAPRHPETPRRAETVEFTERPADRVTARTPEAGDRPLVSVGADTREAHAGGHSPASTRHTPGDHEPDGDRSASRTADGGTTRGVSGHPMRGGHPDSHEHHRSEPGNSGVDRNGGHNGTSGDQGGGFTSDDDPLDHSPQPDDHADSDQQPDSALHDNAASGHNTETQVGDEQSETVIQDAQGRWRNPDGSFARNPDSPEVDGNDPLPPRNRSSEYPHSYTKTTHDYMVTHYTREGTNCGGVPLDQNGNPIPRSQLTWFDPNGAIIPTEKLTYEHTTSVVDHWNTVGYNLSREERIKFYNDVTNLVPMTREENSRLGAEMVERYRQDAGESYTQ